MFGYIYKTGFVAGRLNFNSHVRKMQAPREG